MDFMVLAGLTYVLVVLGTLLAGSGGVSVREAWWSPSKG